MRPRPLALTAAFAAAALALTGCAAKDDATADPAGAITVNATDTACEVSRTTAPAGQVKFTVTNSGSKVNEFYVYGEDDRVVGEVENISPGLTRDFLVDLSEPGTYQTACKPGMAGDGIRADFTVTGSAAAAPTSTDGTLAAAVTEYQAFVSHAVRRAARATPRSSSRWSRPARSTRPRRSTPSPARTGSGSSRWPSRSATSTRRSTAARRSSRRGCRSPATTASRRTCGSTACSPTPRPIADQLLTDVTELVEQGEGGRAQPAPARQRVQGAARRDGHRQDHRRGGALQPHRPVGLRRQLRGLAGRHRRAAPVPQGQEPGPAGDHRRARRPPSTSCIDTHKKGDGFVLYTALTPADVKALTEALDAFSEPVATVAGEVAGTVNGSTRRAVLATGAGAALAGAAAGLTYAAGPASAVGTAAGGCRGRRRSCPSAAPGRPASPPLRRTGCTWWRSTSSPTTATRCATCSPRGPSPPSG